MLNNAVAIADLVIYEITDIMKSTITNLRLQKTLYYLQGYQLKYYDEMLFHNKIEAWRLGPVVPDVYYQFYHYIDGNIKSRISEDEYIELSKNVDKDLVGFVINQANKYEAYQLVNMTHNESPWKDIADLNLIKPIPVKAIKDFFINNDPLNIDSMYE